MYDRNVTLEAEKKNGKYLLCIRSAPEGYVVESTTDRVHISCISINGNYISTNDVLETECDEYSIKDDTLTLWYLDAEMEDDENA